MNDITLTQVAYTPIQVPKCAVEEQMLWREKLCEMLAEKLIRLNPKNELLRFYYYPKDGTEWKAILREFFGRYGAKHLPGDNSVGFEARAHFFGAYALDLETAVKRAEQSN